MPTDFGSIEADLVTEGGIFLPDEELPEVEIATFSRQKQQQLKKMVRNEIWQCIKLGDVYKIDRGKNDKNFFKRIKVSTTDLYK